MDFKIDENLPVEVSQLLKDSGHNSITVPEQNLTGTSDTNLANVCCKEKRVLITLDSDFADIRKYPPSEYSGIIVMRMRRQDKKHVLEIFRQVISLFTKETLKQHLWVVEEDRVRVRT